jgi:protein-tyrosine phosphatase
MSRSSRTSLLFVCTGNICRSPLAEGLFVHKVNRRGVAHLFEVDSAGTGDWHAGDPPDPRSVDVALRREVILPGRARQVRAADLRRFDMLIGMDEEHRDWLLGSGASPERVSLLLEHDPDAPRREVPDPYYGGPDGFETVFRLIDAACDALLERLLADRSGVAR